VAEAYPFLVADYLIASLLQFNEIIGISIMNLLLNITKSYSAMTLLRNDDTNKMIRCSRCNVSFKEEVAAEIHELTHEIVVLRQSLDQRLEMLERTIRHVSSINRGNRCGSF
jgi:signal transduction histidine kinase